MLAFKIILLIGLSVSILMAFGTKDEQEKKHARFMVAILGSLVLLGEIATRLLH